MSDQTCPCGSQRSSTRCCAPLLEGSKAAETAEQLMRSRFTAFTAGNIDYLLDTHHPSKHSPTERQQLAKTLEQYRWLSLEIVRSVQGDSHSTNGTVEFIARYTDGQRLEQLHERSSFIKENGRWFYLDGEFLNSAVKLPGRNAPCWCGSNKKYKHCHG